MILVAAIRSSSGECRLAVLIFNRRFSEDLKFQEEEATMRLIFFIAAIAGTTLISANSSLAAQKEPPWCLKLASSDLAVDLCNYQTFEQCAQERIINGNMSFCFHNPAYIFNQMNPGEQARKSRRKADR
jgi:Protein of unknown function (DUF3551)